MFTVFLYKDGGKMQELELKDNIKIENMIYEVRGVQVMFDSDLAKLYQCANGTKSINLAVKRHINKFLKNFMFQLTMQETKNISRFQNETLIKRGTNIKYLPYVFTEEGVAMLATILKTKVAENISIEIMKAFVSMRHFLIENKDIYKSLDNLNNRIIRQENQLIEHGNKINYIFSKFDKKEQLILPGQIYDSYSNILDIIYEVKKEIIIIDPYADKYILDLIRNIKCNVILITKDSNRLSEIEINKYNKQYNNLKVVRDNRFHDRYIIIDKKDMYLLGASINNIGDKVSMIIKLEDEFIKNILLNNIYKIIK